MNKKGELLRYLGSKHKLAPWIVSFFPEHKFYTESFGATGAVLLKSLHFLRFTMTCMTGLLIFFLF